ncbi:Pc13g04490 [Penicillium rubens Wisconsin 54-1255]|uniref:Pc13g04490 protein n=1 Tax=Penicillium rubens (strain ATCC 28089 / DSM 1075 / NRRL 1951 / Wisconsin 54-1255) TaxID=500485 RepID=B6H2A1_PENRW|nr:Pc13g04490 [Penicillium rubens Wisconsin 54-1255]
MTGFHFSGQQLDNDLVTSISCLLDAADIPNLLWGNYLLTIYGVPTVVDVSISLQRSVVGTLLILRQGVSFVVPDTLIEISYSTLSKAGFLPCTQSSDCPYSNTLRCPPPVTHLHIDDEKSDVLWEFPDFEIASHNNNSDIWCASDTRLPPASLGRGQGRFPPHLYSVQIPSALRYCEALILLLCRDYGSVCETYWMAILTYMLEFVDGTDILDEEGLSEGYRPFYRALKQADSRMYLLLEELRRDLIERRILPVK